MRLTAILLLVCSAPAFAAGGTCPASVPSGITSCFFADFATGADTNNGTSESTPWKNLPFMNGCASSCIVTPVAGEGFIMKGGVTWTASALEWNWNASGTGTTSSPGCTGSGCIYIGVDPLWFTGASWARPILNAGGTAITGTNVLMAVRGNDLIVDNIEFTGLFWSGVPSFGTGANLSLAGGSPGLDVNDTFEHLYIHGWSHGTSGGGTVENPCGVVGDTGDPNNNANTILEFSVLSGADTAQDSCSLIDGGPPFIAFNVLEYGSSGMIIDSPVSVHDNLVQNVVTSFQATAHENAMEVNFGPTATFYNNVFRHIGSGSLTVWLAPDNGATHYFFNNVVYDTDVNNVLDFAASLQTNPSGSIVAWNNTVECGPDSNPAAVCAAGIDSHITAVTLQNNHFITNATSPNGGMWSDTNGTSPVPTVTTSIVQSKTTANGQGYTSAQTNAFSPTAAFPTNSTPGQGTSATTLCTNSGVGAACGLTTTYGVAYNATNHTVSTPGLATATLNSPPDIGAYQFQSGGAGNSSTLLGVKLLGAVIH